MISFCGIKGQRIGPADFSLKLNSTTFFGRLLCPLANLWIGWRDCNRKPIFLDSFYTMPPAIRRQLTLFVPPHDATAIETIRSRYNPVQRALIDSHVTLCREDELVALDRVVQNLQNILLRVTIDFGAVVRTEGGKGVLLPAIGGQETFQRLRKAVLAGVVEAPRQHEAHITLMHPRNSTCTDAIFDEICTLTLPKQLAFNAVSLIEQVDGGPWQILQTTALV
jgi:hypothetical protein